MVVINHGGERVAFMGDLVPTHHHLRVGCIPSLDVFPEETLETKRELLDEAERHGWLMVFSHGLDTRAGYLERRMGDLNFRPVDF
jgi:glyoxylase-like metal-dependent hydrolase (beta-lactamase superfamily II)